MNDVKMQTSWLFPLQIRWGEMKEKSTLKCVYIYNLPKYTKRQCKSMLDNTMLTFIGKKKVLVPSKTKKKEKGFSNYLGSCLIFDCGRQSLSHFSEYVFAILFTSMHTTCIQ